MPMVGMVSFFEMSAASLGGTEDHDPFELLIEEQKEKRGVTNDTDLTTDDLRELVAKFKPALKVCLSLYFQYSKIVIFYKCRKY